MNDYWFTAFTANATGVTSYVGTRCFDRDGNSLIRSRDRLVAEASTSHSLSVDIASEPMGVIQQIGDKARFGLMEFKGAG